MKNLFRIVIVGLFFSFILLGCSADDECGPVIIATTSLETQYGCLSTAATVDIDLDNTYTIIRNQTDYDTLVSGSCDVAIDFTIFDLLIGKQQLTSGFNEIYYGMIRNCDNGRLYLEVFIELNAAAVAPNVTYHVLVPKLGDTEDIEVSVVTN